MNSPTGKPTDASAHEAEKSKLVSAFKTDEYGAVCVDTNIFDASGKRLADGPFALLGQFSTSGLALLFPDVIAGEVLGHLKQRYDTEKEKQTGAIRQLSKTLSAKLIDAIEDELKTARRDAGDDFKNYLNKVDGEIILAQDYTNFGNLLESYFNTRPPFSASGEKKAEFPDAIALLTLEGWATKRKKKVLCVSTDSDWVDYCKTSNLLVTTNDLSVVLAANVAAYEERAAQAKAAFIELIKSAKAENQVNECLQAGLENVHANINAASNYYYEYDIDSLSLLSHDLDTSSEMASPVTFSHGVAVFEVPVKIEINVETSLTFSTWDSIDKEYVAIGSRVVESEFGLKTDILVHVDVAELLNGKRTELLPEDIEAIELVNQRIDVELDEVGPDYDHEDHDYEDEHDEPTE
nr:PIN domain-containing protein [uncultured Cupriavidus sp.]